MPEGAFLPPGVAKKGAAAAGSLTGSTLASGVTASSITSVGTIATGTWEGTDVGVAHGGTGASTLTANGVLVGNGTSAVGAVDMTTKGHILIGDGSGNPRMLAVGSNNQVLTADSGETTGVKWAAAAGGAVALEGSNTTLAATTSTSITNLISVTSLTIGATTPFFFCVDEKKSTGAAAGVGFGLTLNSTTCYIPTPTENRFSVIDANNDAQVGINWCFFGSRVSDFLSVGAGMNSAHDDDGGARGGNVPLMHDDSECPNAEITSVIVPAISGNGSVEAGADEVHVYSLANS